MLQGIANILGALASQSLQISTQDATVCAPEPQHGINSLQVTTKNGTVHFANLL
jgi:hypothetical protein